MMHVSASRLFYKTHCCQRPSKLNFRLKSERGCRWRRAVTYAPNSCEISRLDRRFFLSSFFHSNFPARNYANFQNFDDFPDDPITKKKITLPFNHEWFLISRKNLIYRSKGGEMIRDYLLLLSWLCAVQGKIGKYIKIWRCVRVRAILNLFFFEGRFFERYVRKKRKITLISPSITYHGINKLTWRTIVPK